MASATRPSSAACSKRLAWADVAVQGRTAAHPVRDAEAPWEGGPGSIARTGAVIDHQPVAVRPLIRSAFERRAAARRTGHGLTVPAPA